MGLLSEDLAINHTQTREGMISHALSMAMKISTYTRDQAYRDHLLQDAIALECELLQETIRYSNSYENRERAKRTLQKITTSGRRYTFASLHIVRA